MRNRLTVQRVHHGSLAGGGESSMLNEEKLFLLDQAVVAAHAWRHAPIAAWLASSTQRTTNNSHLLARLLPWLSAQSNRAGALHRCAPRRVSSGADCAQICRAAARVRYMYNTRSL
jgi:hypothetical protein